jgi:quercetin dioxygenase-like cupin family protein
MTEPEIHDPRAIARSNPPQEGKAFRITFVNRTERSTTVVASVLPGRGMEPHVHLTHDEIITLVEGEADFRIGHRTQHVTAGETVSVPAGAVHGPVRTVSGCILVAVYAPEYDPASPDRHVVED